MNTKFKDSISKDEFGIKLIGMYGFQGLKAKNSKDKATTSYYNYCVLVGTWTQGEGQILDLETNVLGGLIPAK